VELPGKAAVIPILVLDRRRDRGRDARVRAGVLRDLARDRSRMRFSRA
jgi:hypothetical protein